MRGSPGPPGPIVSIPGILVCLDRSQKVLTHTAFCSQAGTHCPYCPLMTASFGAVLSHLEYPETPCSTPLPVGLLREGPRGGHAFGSTLFPVAFSTTLGTQVALQPAWYVLCSQISLHSTLTLVPTRAWDGALHSSVGPFLGKATKAKPGVSTQNSQGCW